MGPGMTNPGPGRPPVGPVVKVRLPDRIVAILDAQVAAGAASSRASLIRSIIDDWTASRAE